MRINGLVSILAALAALVPAARCLGGPGINTRELIESALDEPARITLENVNLGDAIRAVWDQTGVRVAMPPSAMGLVPYGEKTVIERVEIADVPLRDGLRRLLEPLGMTFEVRDDHIEVVPKEALRCLGRRPSWDELDTLSELAAMQPGIDQAALAALRNRVQFKIPAPGGWATLSSALVEVGAGPGDEVLTVACRNLGWAWCPSGRQVVITSRADYIRDKLAAPISLRMNYRLIIDVLQEVGRLADVPVKVEPGALSDLPLNVQKSFILNVSNEPAEKVLDAIAANTGLGYLIEPEGVLFYKFTAAGPATGSDGSGSAPGSAASSTSAGTSGRDPFVGKIVVRLDDEKTVEWFVRESELPEDLRQRRRDDLERAFKALRVVGEGPDQP